MEFLQSPGKTQACDGKRLVQMMRQGQTQAVDVMARCFGERLISVSRQRCMDEEQAKDAVQDAFVAATEFMKTFRGEGSVEGWLVRMVINACSHLRRGRKNDPNLHDPEVVLEDLNANPEKEAFKIEMGDNLQTALSALPQKDRMLVMLSDAEGWKAKELAQAFSMTPGAVRSRLSRARAKLRGLLEPYWHCDDFKV